MDGDRFCETMVGALSLKPTEGNPSRVLMQVRTLLRLHALVH